MLAERGRRLLPLHDTFPREKIQQRPHRGQQPAPRREDGVDDPRLRPPVRQDMDQAPGFHVLPDHHGRQLHDAEARQRRLAQAGHVVRHQTGAVGHGGGLTIRMRKVPDMIALGPAEIQTRQASKIGRRRQRFRQQRRAGDKALGALVELAHHEVGGLKRRKAHADGDVEPLGNDIDPAVGGLQMHLDRRIFEHEAADERPELERQQRDRAAHADDAARLGARLGDELVRRLRLHQHGDAALVILPPDFGDCEPARGAVQQTHAQPLLQRQNAAAEPGFLQAERAGGRREPAVIDDSNEVGEVVQVFHRSTNRTMRRLPQSSGAGVAVLNHVQHRPR